jgi:hypothetical protein
VNVAAVQGSGGKTVSQHLVTVDSCAICEPEVEGIIINKGSGELRTTLTIDTVGLHLANGLHHLSIRAYAPSSVGSTLSGTLVIPFVVSN